MTFSLCACSFHHSTIPFHPPNQDPPEILNILLYTQTSTGVNCVCVCMWVRVCLCMWVGVGVCAPIQLFIHAWSSNITIYTTNKHSLLHYHTINNCKRVYIAAVDYVCLCTCSDNFILEHVLKRAHPLNQFLNQVILVLVIFKLFSTWLCLVLSLIFHVNINSVKLGFITINSGRKTPQ